MDFPRINNNFMGKSYQYLYAVGKELLHPNKVSRHFQLKDYEIRIFCQSKTCQKQKRSCATSQLFQIYKVDMESKDIMTWKDPGYYVSEPTFVARPEAEAEDDGVLLVTLLNATSQCNVSLVILDARDLREVARLRFETEGSVSQAMHGLFSLTHNHHQDG